jgi:hypothetical protein
METIDPDIIGDTCKGLGVVRKVFQLALLCTKRQPSDRPTVHDVVRCPGVPGKSRAPDGGARPELHERVRQLARHQRTLLRQLVQHASEFETGAQEIDMGASHSEGCFNCKKPCASFISDDVINIHLGQGSISCIGP